MKKSSKKSVTAKKNGGKTPSESAVVMRELVMPGQANIVGTIFGGVIMSWIDIAGAMCAMNHAGKQVVTVSIDNIHFKLPVKIGHQVIIKAMCNDVGRTSMEIGVRVESYNPVSGEVHLCCTAHLTFVAVDDLGRPTNVPPLILKTQEEIERSERAKKRKLHRFA